MLTSSDFKELLNLFKKYNVRYLIVGGYAVMKYSEPRFTKDLDLLISVDKQNAKSVYQALKEFGAPLEGLSESDFQNKDYFYQMGVPPIRIDILMSIPGVSFDEAWENRETVNIDSAEIQFIGKTDLIRSKHAAGRPQDLLDAEQLEKS